MTQACGFLDLQEIREGLDSLATKIGGSGRFALSIAAPRGAHNHKKLHIAEMDCHLDCWNLMVRNVVFKEKLLVRLYVAA